MDKQKSVMGLNIKGKRSGCDKACQCDTCKLARASRQNPPKGRRYDDDATRPFEVVYSDIKGPLMDSHGGLRYSISFVDEVTRNGRTYFMKHKSEAPTMLKEYLSWVKGMGWYVGVIKTDRGSEYFGNDTRHIQKCDKKTL